MTIKSVSLPKIKKIVDTYITQNEKRNFNISRVLYVFKEGPNFSIRYKLTRSKYLPHYKQKQKYQQIL